MFKKVVIGILGILNILMLVAVWQSRPNMPANQVQKSKIEQNQRQNQSVKNETKLLTTSSVLRFSVEKKRRLILIRLRIRLIRLSVTLLMRYITTLRVKRILKTEKRLT